MALHFATLPRGRRNKRTSGSITASPSVASAGTPTDTDIDSSASELFHFLLEAGLDRHFAALNRRLRRPASPAELANLSSRRLRHALHGFSVDEIRRFRQRLLSERRHRTASLMGRVLRRLLPGGQTSLRARLPASELSASTLPKCTSSTAEKTAPAIPQHCLRMGSQLSQSLQQASWHPGGEPVGSVPVILRTKSFEAAAPIDKLASLRHRSVARLLGVTGGGQMLLVTELAPFGSLLDCLQEPRLRAQLHPGALCILAQQLAEAMSYLENRHQPHGRLSASNVLVFALDRVKLAHPCLGSLASSDAEVNDSTSAQFEAWSAPELIPDAPPTIQADVWSFGVTLLEIFSYGLTPSRMSRQLPTCPEACPARLYRDVIVNRCWQRDPVRRASFSQLALHLPKLLPERRVAVRDHPKRAPAGLDLLQGDVVVVLDGDNHNENDDGFGCGWRGARIPSSVQADIHDDDAADDDVITFGRFDPSATAPLAAGGISAPAKGAAVEAVSATVTRRATLGTSYAREFGQRISRFKRAAQSRLLHPSPIMSESSDHHLEQQQGQVTDAPSATDNSSSSSTELLRQQPRRRRVTSDMISEPRRAEFRHAGHVGADGTVFGDVSCLAELELAPTCEPPVEQQRIDDVAADSSDNSSIVYRRQPRQVENLREQSGYCRLGSSLSLGVESVAISSTSIEYDCVDDADEPSTGDGGLLNFGNNSSEAGDGDNGMSLIDEILRAWGDAANVNSALPDKLPESDASLEVDTNNLNTKSAKEKSLSKGSFSDCSHCSTNSGCCTDARCAENNTTPVSSVSSLNGNTRSGVKQQRQHNCTSALFCSSPISVSPVCSSSVSSLDSPVPHRAEAAAHLSTRGHHHSSPPPLLQLAAVIASAPLTADCSLADKSGNIDYDEDIVNM